MPLPHVTSLRSAWLCGVGRPWAPGRSRGTWHELQDAAVRGCGGAGAGAVVVVEKSKCGQLMDGHSDSQRSALVELSS